MNSSTDILREIIKAQKTGDHLKVFDLAEAALKLDPDDVLFQYHSVLALARCGAKQRALDSFYHYKLYLSESEDVLALEARILKDLALVSHDIDSLRKAADSYKNIYSKTGGYYPAINAATLYFLAADTVTSGELAERALDRAIKDDGDRFFALATQAEALILLGRNADAGRVIEQISALRGDNLLMRARTRQQLKLICDYRNMDAGMLDALLPESVIHYCGHIFDQHRPLSEQDESALLQRIESVLSENKAAIAYGSLAAGSDILFAEAFLATGGELNIWLPFQKSEFCDISVRPSGEQWVGRFEACLARANSVSYATESEFMGDDSLFEYGADICMGMAIMRANSLNARAIQIAVWDQLESEIPSSTARNVHKWRELNHHSEVIPSPVSRLARVVRPQGKRSTHCREPHAILFSDVRGFSGLCDRDVLWYFDVLHPCFALAIEKFRPEILLLDTWGDAIYLVTKKATTAARIAAELNEALAKLEQSSLDIKTPLLLRIGLHYGPVFSLYDHLAQKQTYSSNEVSKTARIEPVTPPGEIFGTEAFVAQLALEGENRATCEYAGILPSAKNYGDFRMFHIRA